MLLSQDFQKNFQANYSKIRFVHLAGKVCLRGRCWSHGATRQCARHKPEEPGCLFSSWRQDSAALAADVSRIYAQAMLKRWEACL